MAQHPSTASSHDGSGDTSVRTCVGCRKQGLRSELLRVVAERGRVVVDEGRRLPGRGAWLHPVQDCLALAIRRKALPRALRVSGELDAGGVEAFLGGGAAAARIDRTDTGASRVLPK